MARTLVIFATLAFAAQARSDEKPNTLTPQEIANGWILLFDGDTTFGWKIEGDAEVKDGVLILGKTKKTRAEFQTRFGISLDVAIQYQGAGTIYASASRIDFDTELATNSDWCDTYHGWNGKDRIIKVDGPGSTTVKPHEPKLEHSPLIIETDGKNPIHVRSVKLRMRNQTELFNGKNLDGWSINKTDPKRLKSNWKVTENGELSLKDGPGDLFAEKEFDNFVLQLECRTNGKLLNSGVFFRCIPGQYQNGYEAQIYNGYKDNDRTQPLDYGTGGIYRRIAARKIVSNDNEWFTMTIVANDKQIATWVNGYQTVNWTDDRKAHPNPREGFRAEKGHISLQGHDPTTDLLFRNIRITEITKE